MEIEKKRLDEIHPYAGNAKLHPAEQVEQIKKSIEQFGNNDPIAIDEDGIIIEGHGRYLALKELGYDEAEVIVLKGMTEDEKNAYRLVHNQLTMNSGFDLELLQEELQGIGIDLEEYGFSSDEEEIDESEAENPYTTKTEIPQYQPTGKNVSLKDCLDEEKAKSLMEEIKASDLGNEEKRFLLNAATRLYAFNYSNVAEYYCSKASPEMQRLMEKLALVIIDINDAIKNGYTALTAEIHKMIDEADYDN